MNLEVYNLKERFPFLSLKADDPWAVDAMHNIRVSLRSD